jgi:hypothetical protein
MYSIVNDLESRVIANLSSDSELIDKVRRIAIKNDDRIAPIDSVNDCFEYINEYTENLDLVLDSDVDNFITKYGIEVEEYQIDSYIQLMLIDNYLIQWKNKKYYISNSLDLNLNEIQIEYVLGNSLHI